MSEENGRKIHEAAEAELNAADKAREAARIWRAARVWEDDSPAYKWAAGGGDKAGVWTLGVGTIPAGLRYMAAPLLPEKHKWMHMEEVDGFIVAAMASVENWLKAYPKVPEPVEAVHTVAINADGKQVDIKGTDKRSFGLARGKVCAVWAPNAAKETTGASVCEGVADAMAIVSSAFKGAGNGIAFAVLNAMRNDDIAAELALLRGAAWIYPDHDDDGRGTAAAMDMAKKIRAANGRSHIADYDDEAEDPADAAMRRQKLAP